MLIYYINNGRNYQAQINKVSLNKRVPISVKKKFLIIVSYYTNFLINILIYNLLKMTVYLMRNSQAEIYIKITELRINMLQFQG